MSYTLEQLDAIHTHDRNLIVTAGAGSGKTRVLVDRFVALLEAHPDWSLPSLVAITFTEKAAREMRDRVRKSIEDRISSGSRTQDHDAIRRWRDHQAALDSARIGTIHSLCTSILRSNAAEVEIDPAFEVLDEIEAAILRSEAIEQALARLTEGSSDAVRLLAEYEVRIVTQVLLAMIAVPDESLLAPVDYLDKWHTAYRKMVSDALEWLRQDTAFIEALTWEPTIDPSESDKLWPSWELVVTHRNIVLSTDSSPDEVLGVLAQWNSEIKAHVGTAAAWGGKEHLDIAKANLKLIKETCKKLLDQLGDFGEADARAADLLPLWGEAIAAAKVTYKELKRHRRALDFDDLESLTRRLLRDERVAGRYHNTEFKHILVDEFQDTNAAQRDIIRALAGADQAGSLFVVGDPRQSIYQFRGADVRVFDAVRAEVLATGGREILLDTSFRTHEKLLNGFNSIFSTLMVRDEGPNADFAVTHGTPMKASRPSNGQPCLEIILMDKELAPKHSNSADDLRRWEAGVLARRLKEMVDGSWQVWDKAQDHYGALQYGDIAVLFQASKNMQIVEEAFKSAHIPYVTVAGKGYYSRSEVWDLLNLLKALYNPADDLALASALRSPLYNLSDDDLFALRLQRPPNGSTEHLSLWTTLTDKDRNYNPALPDSLQVEFARESLLRLRGVAGRVTIAELLVRALDETAYLATLSGLSDGARRVGNVEKLLEVARRSGRVALGEFTLYLQDLTEREAREGEALVATEGAVQLMTVHASKGLEFPVVALFDASWEGKSHVETFVIDPILGPACCVRNDDGEMIEPFAFRLAKRYAAERDAAERIRLLYVAMTRAQDYVIVSGRDDVSKGWLSQLLKALNLAADSLSEETLIPFDWGDCLLRVPLYASHQRSSDGEGLPPESRESTKAWDQLTSSPIPDVQPTEPALLAAVPADRHASTRMMSATEIAVLGEARATGHLSRFRQHMLGDGPMAIHKVIGTDSAPQVSRRLVGEIVHQALRWWRLPSTTPDLKDLLGSYAWEQGITDPQMLETAITEAAELLERTERSGIVAEINQALQVFRELPFTFTLGNRTINGIIDVLFFSKYQRWHIVDYKTAAVPSEQEGVGLNARLREHAVRYHPQVGIYAAAVEAMTGQAPEVHIHYIRYVHTLNIDRAVWQAVLSTLDDDIVSALDGADTSDQA